MNAGSSSTNRSRILAALDSSTFFSDASSSVNHPAEQQTLGKRPYDDAFVSVLGVSKIRRKKARVPVPLIASQQKSEIVKKLTDSGFSLNYDSETPVRQIDVGGPDQVEKLAEFVYNSIENSGEGRTVRDAVRKLGLQSDRDLLPGLEVRLMPHQLIGVSWMVDQERASPHKGGILALSGLTGGTGKTVQMIATMAMNLPKDSSKPTLIIVPAALLQQWKEEIETKTNDLFTVHIHHGRDKLTTTVDVESKDVIITTYQTASNELSVPLDIDEGEELHWLEDHGGVLSRVKWHRVILDEAHFIRNRATVASRSLALLRANYRWMLTGTPVTNTLYIMTFRVVPASADIYGLIRFGRFRPWNDWTDFNSYVARVQRKDPPLAAMRAQEILRPLLLRRTKDAHLDGVPILQLPTKHIDLVTLEFSPDERELYDNFEKRSRIRINRYINNRTLLKKQLCCHPNLILVGDFKILGSLISLTSFLSVKPEDKELGRAIKIMGNEWPTTMFIFSDEADGDDFCPVCKDIYTRDTGRVLACGHELCFDCLLELSNSAIMHDGEFGHGTEQENMRQEKEYELATAKGYRPCPVCKKMSDLTQQWVFKSCAFEPDREELRDAASAEKRARRSERASKSAPLKPVIPSRPVKSRFRGGTPVGDSSEDELPDFSQLFASKGNFKKKVKKLDKSSTEVYQMAVEDQKVKEEASGDGKEPTALSETLLAVWSRGDDDLEPSTKMLALIDSLREAAEHGDKSICFSQWTSMLDLVETLFRRYGISSVRYDGKMDRAAREKALATFKRHDGPKVILISTRCGGVGLNLVAANRIVNLDLSWNYAAESQAYDRTHRLGQEKEVYIKRLVVRDTIEERMLRLQEVKSDLADAALGEGNGIKLHKMSVQEIQALAMATTEPVLDLMFSEDLISAEVVKQLPAGLTMRPLSSTDYKRGHLSVLSVLSVVDDLGEDAWVAQFRALRALPKTYYCLVIVDQATDKIVGVGTVFMEHKFLAGVKQGKKLGMRIIQALTHISENSGCYKTILNCSDANIPFYEKCGFTKKENEMAKYAPERTHPPKL
ncbi:P-loop containing nucleoside triphosphate hydrolase protein [Pisolithus microcarpus]|nr:P-loop containing nucleoside triphosphate hydrolase protein [Pisolithus microcarpus]